MTKTIAIIGAGATGMTAAKACLEQGMTPVVFEKTHYTGGLWRFKESLDEDGVASVMKSTIINSSKEMSAFSDFPPPAEFPNYMHNTKMVAYFDMYAEQFNFNRYVKLKHEIVSVEMADDYDHTGRWRVTARNLEQSGKLVVGVYDGVMVCTGHHGKISMPNFAGQDKFRGKILHTHSLKTAQGFEDKSVVVVGIGNSGGDAAVELSVVAKQVYLSTRRGSWIFQRVGPKGRPFDQYFHRRLFTMCLQYLPYWLVCLPLEMYMNSVFDHEDYHLKPKHRALSQHIMVNDALPNRILSGTVTVKSDIDHFTEEGVRFKGDDQVTKCDAVVMATGYKVEFPFLAEDIVSVHKNRVRLYKYQFVPHLKHPHTLCFLSLAQPIGALLPIGELQARWFSLLMAGKLRLPTRGQMEEDIENKAKFQTRFYESERHTIQVDWVPFMDELAREIGAYPPIGKYLLTDPRLFLALTVGASAPYQYRLVGPNSWQGAREAMLTVQHRIQSPLKTNALKAKSTNRSLLSQMNVIYFVALFGFSFVLLTFLTILLKMLI